MNQLNVAAIQMVSGFDLDKNLLQAHCLIEQLKQHNIHLMVLPENCFMFSAKQFLALANDDLSQKKIHNFLVSTAKSYQCYVIAGSVPLKSYESGKVYSACLVYDPDGNRIATYHKIHLFDVEINDNIGSYRESDTIVAGNEPKTFLLDGIRVGLSICYDLRFPELYRRLADLNCDILVVPSAFTFHTGSMHWDVLLRARAIENQCYLLASNQGGEHISESGKRRKTYGHSMIVDSQGSILSQLQLGEGVCWATLDLTQQAKQRSAMPVLEHRRL